MCPPPVCRFANTIGVLNNRSFTTRELSDWHRLEIFDIFLLFLRFFCFDSFLNDRRISSGDQQRFSGFYQLLSSIQNPADYYLPTYVIIVKIKSAVPTSALPRLILKKLLSAKPTQLALVDTDEIFYPLFSVTTSTDWF
jgi:hypothetical protein